MYIVLYAIDLDVYTSIRNKIVGRENACLFDKDGYKSTFLSCHTEHQKSYHRVISNFPSLEKASQSTETNGTWMRNSGQDLCGDLRSEPVRKSLQLMGGI